MHVGSTTLCPRSRYGEGVRGAQGQAPESIGPISSGSRLLGDAACDPLDSPLDSGPLEASLATRTHPLRRSFPFVPVSPTTVAAPAPAIRIRRFAADCAALAQPWLLAEILRFVRGGRAWERSFSYIPSGGLPQGLALCALLFLACAFQALALGQYKWGARLAGTLMRDTAAAVVYARALHLRAPSAADVEHVRGLLATDCEHFRAYAAAFHDRWAAPLTLLVAGAQLLFLLGPGALAGALVAASLLVLQERTAAAEAALRLRARRRTDARVALTADILRFPRAAKLAGCALSHHDCTSVQRRMQQCMEAHTQVAL